MMLLLAVVLFQGCTERDQRTETNTTQTIDPALQTLELQIETVELPENNDTTVTLKTDDGQDITSNKNIVWLISDTNVTEINGTKLFAKAEGTATIRAEVDGEYSQEQNVTVYKIIHGHRLPPEPDKEKNNATLLGIDDNNNGIRDDVERLIIVEEAKNLHFPKTQTALSLQYAWAWQKIIEAPILKNRIYLEKYTSCQRYFEKKYTKEMTFTEYMAWAKENASTILGIKLEDQIFNTRARIEQRFEFNKICSGNLFDLPPADLTACQINIDELSE
ncbi:hypothetical protein LOH54_11970 [Sulfurimonas sp. HSL-3221]|uniref:Ig-like domain-containing protein n=1 Tax=Thiomicrolovo sulfuroxydans TaxID=2894755 RepID=UPI001E655F1D|nr:hypothetical protein [Sulfurimonas sp. HSL-3221]UFS62356.1 hypothetical protein LOH54_11970 [Sulfurimonas sp. HSL-3221]